MQVVSRGREVAKTAQDILGILNKSLPYGLGVAFGLVNLALEYRDVNGMIKNLRRRLLRNAFAFLVATEDGASKLGQNSGVDFQGCQNAIKAAIFLCCGVGIKGSEWYGD